MRNVGRVLALISSSVVLYGHAWAAGSSSQFNVTVTVTKDCTVTAPASFAFGAVSASTILASGMLSSQSFTVLCSNGTPYTLNFAGSNDPTVGTSTHVLKGTGANADVLQYTLVDLTSGATNASPLGGSTSIISDIGTGIVQTKLLQAKILSPASSVAADTYSDTVTLAVSY